MRVIKYTLLYVLILLLPAR